jgi:hypothetical protein
LWVSVEPAITVGIVAIGYLLQHHVALRFSAWRLDRPRTPHLELMAELRLLPVARPLPRLVKFSNRPDNFLYIKSYELVVLSRC